MAGLGPVCPDGGTCHHRCPARRDFCPECGQPVRDHTGWGLGGCSLTDNGAALRAKDQVGAAACFRVLYCGPLSNVYPGDSWPDEVRAEHADEKRTGVL